MSLAINISTPDGLILAADSRQTYVNRKGQARVGSDSATKLFKLTPKIGLAAVGPAFLAEDGIQKNIAYFIERFIKEKISGTDSLYIEDIAKKIEIYFDDLFAWKKELDRAETQLREQATRIGGTDISINKDNGTVIVKYKLGNEIKTMAAAINPLQFFLAGYNPDGSHQVFIISIPGGLDKKRDSNERGKEFGSSWVGQTDVVTRIVLGFDSRIGGLPFVVKAINMGDKTELERQLRQLEYSIQWGTMTLQDGADFARLMIETTSAIQRFSDGILADPGDIPGVGGFVDVVVITPRKGFVWLSKKQLKVNQEMTDLDAFEDLPETKVAKNKKGGGIDDS